MIQTIGLTKRYGQNLVLDGIDLMLEDGKIYGLLGRNGVGKTTLLNILSNQIRATGGQVLLDGEEIYENAKAVEQIALVREWGVGRDLRIDRLFQAAGIMYRNWDQPYAEKLIKKYNINLKNDYSKLSRGEQTMVGFILGLASRCRYTFFDEPSLGLDAANRDDFYRDLLEDYEQNPRTIVISTHLIDEGANLFEDVIILKDKQVLIKDSVANLLDQSFLLSGPADSMVGILEGKQVLDREHFGQREMVSVLGELSDEEALQLKERGVEILPIGLQKLFVLLTK